MKRLSGWVIGAAVVAALCGLPIAGDAREADFEVIHGLRSQVHALLGGQVVYLVLAGLGLAALAGLGGGLILDNVNTNKRRRSLGWLLLLAGLPLFGLCFFLGLP